MVRVRHCLVFPLFCSFSSPFPFPVLFPVSSFTLPFPSPFLFPVLFPFLFGFLFRSFSFRFPFLFLLLSFSCPFPFPVPFLFLSFSSPFPILSFPFLYYSFSFPLSSLMWILWSRCEANAWKNDKRKNNTITSGKPIWKGSGFLQTPSWFGRFCHPKKCHDATQYVGNVIPLVVHDDAINSCQSFGAILTCEPELFCFAVWAAQA